MDRIAVVGAGIAGLAAARSLVALGSPVTLFEAEARFGGHARTVDVTLEGLTHGVDTGFLVYNETTYPRLTRLFADLGVRTVASDMSFSVQLPAVGLEWSGSSLASVFAQKRNLLRPRFARMLADILRFNRLATALAVNGRAEGLVDPVGEFLDAHGFSQAFREQYLLPMLGCIWSCPVEQMLRFPVGTLVRFCHNHGLLRIHRRPQWRSVAGGSRDYVRRLVAALPDARAGTPVLGVERTAAGALVRTATGCEAFDAVVFACHPAQTLQLLGEGATAAERGVLGALRHHRNRAVLHTDASVLPRRTIAWSAWNYEARAEPGDAQVCVHYLIGRLQPLPWRRPVIVTLNPLREPQGVLDTWEVEHPVFDHAALHAQQALPSLQGERHTWFCGAWTGHGFHEDGCVSGEAVAQDIASRRLTRTAEAA
jgi:predicted NAD/FAD-binding protein